METNITMRQLRRDPDVRYRPSVQLEDLLMPPKSLDRAVVPLLNEIVRLGGKPVFSGASTGYISLGGSDEKTERMARALAKAVGATALRYRHHQSGNGDETVVTSITWEVKGRRTEALDQGLLTAAERLEGWYNREPMTNRGPWALVEKLFGVAREGYRPGASAYGTVHDEPDRGNNAAVTLRLDREPGDALGVHAATWAKGWYWESNGANVEGIENRVKQAFGGREL